MAHPAPAASRCTSEEFFELVARGVLAPDDRVELLAVRWAPVPSFGNSFL